MRRLFIQLDELPEGVFNLRAGIGAMQGGKEQSFIGAIEIRMNAGESPDRASHVEAGAIVKCSCAHERNVLGGSDIDAGACVQVRIDMVQDRTTVSVDI